MTAAVEVVPESRLRHLALRVGALAGFRRLALAFGLGLLSAAAFAPLYLVFLLLPAFMGLVWLVDGAARGRGAFAAGWAFGVGHFLGGLYWVGIAMTVDLERFWWFIPISVGSLSLGLSLFTGAATWIAWRSRWRGPAFVLLLAAAWLLMEWLRSWVLTGFPWNLLGSVWAFSPLTLQPAAYGGVWLLSVVTLLAAAMPALPFLPGAGRRAWRAPAAAWLLLLLVMGAGALRLADAPAVGAATVPGVQLRLVQPSVDQALKWRADQRRRQVEQLFEMTRGPGYEAVTHVVWPETAVFSNLWQDQPLLADIGGLLAPGRVLLTGAPRYVQGEGAWNSLYAVDAGGTVLTTYDKTHLVPFGEYVPFREVLGWINITVTQGSFQPGAGAQTLAVPGLPAFSPLICYEVIFPGQVTAAEGPAPDFLLNVTNDAWFGRSSGPYQHLAAARLRAVEQGLPLVRAANNGVSVVLDGYGRTWSQLAQDVVGVIDSPLPERVLHSTVFSRAENWSVALLLAVLVVAAAALHSRFR